MTYIVCKCGYEGNQMIQYETETPSRQLMEWGNTSYADHVQWVKTGTKTLNWACPKCGNVFVQQRGGLSYDQHELKDMIVRLWNSTWRNKQYLRDLEKTKQSLKEVNKIVGERHDIELDVTELDVTELCCQWTEHEDIDGYNSNCCRVLIDF